MLYFFQVIGPIARMYWGDKGKNYLTDNTLANFKLSYLENGASEAKK